MGVCGGGDGGEGMGSVRVAWPPSWLVAARTLSLHLLTSHSHPPPPPPPPPPPAQRRYSVAKIETSQTYEKGRPKLGGLSDPRMGTMDRALKCTTDGNGVLDCPGYFGHIELAKPMFHVHFLKTVVKTLRCVSYHNSKIMLLPVSSAPLRGRPLVSRSSPCPVVATSSLVLRLPLVPHPCPPQLAVTLACTAACTAHTAGGPQVQVGQAGAQPRAPPAHLDAAVPDEAGVRAHGWAAAHLPPGARHAENHGRVPQAQGRRRRGHGRGRGLGEQAGRGWAVWDRAQKGCVCA